MALTHLGAAASDERLKEDVVTSTAGLSFIKDLRPITYKWKAKDAVASSLPQYDADSTDPVYGSGKTQHGFIAQEVKAAINSHSEIKKTALVCGLKTQMAHNK